MTDEDDLRDDAQPTDVADGLEALVEDLSESDPAGAIDEAPLSRPPEPATRPPPLPPRRIPPRLYVLGGVVVLVACVAAVVVSQFLFTDEAPVTQPAVPQTTRAAAPEGEGAEEPAEPAEPETVRIQLPEVVIGAEVGNEAPPDESP